MNKILVIVMLSLFVVLSIGVFTDVAHSEDKDFQELSKNIFEVSKQVNKSMQENENIVSVVTIFDKEIDLMIKIKNTCLLKSTEYIVSIGTLKELALIDLQLCRLTMPLLDASFTSDAFVYASYLIKNGDKSKAKKVFRALVITYPNSSTAKKAEFALEDMVAEEKIAEEKAKNEAVKPAAKTKKKSKSAQ